jgi:hypothetical protein
MGEASRFGISDRRLSDLKQSCAHSMPVMGTAAGVVGPRAINAEDWKSGTARIDHRHLLTICFLSFLGSLIVS